MPRFVMIEQHPFIDSLNGWELLPHQRGKNRVIQTGFAHGTKDQTWITLGSGIVEPTDNVILRGEVIFQGNQPVIIREQEYDNGRIYVAAFGRFDLRPTLRDKVFDRCPNRLTSLRDRAYWVCNLCGETYDERSRHPEVGGKWEWKYLDAGYQSPSDELHVGIIALGETLRNRRHFICLEEGTSVRIPGKANPGEPRVPDFLIEYIGGEIDFVPIPPESESEPAV